MFALTINASILILAASTFHQTGQTNVTELEEVHSFLSPLLGSAFAPTLFAIALSLRAELHGDGDALGADRHGGLSRHSPAALPPAARHPRHRHRACGHRHHLVWREGTAQLLILSQVVLSLQLPFAIVPLVMFTSDKGKMGALIAPRWLTALAAVTAIIVITLNLKLLWDFFSAAL